MVVVRLGQEEGDKQCLVPGWAGRGGEEERRRAGWPATPEGGDLGGRLLLRRPTPIQACLPRSFPSFPLQSQKKAAFPEAPYASCDRGWDSPPPP